MNSDPQVDVNPYGEPQPIDLRRWLRGKTDLRGIEDSQEATTEFLIGLSDALVKKGVLTVSEVIRATGDHYVVDAAIPRKEAL